MRRFWTIIVAAVCICSLAFADDAATAKVEVNKKAVEQPMSNAPLNNVIRMDMTGKRTAMCCCGAEFTVTDKAPTMDRKPTTFYMCGDGCKEMAMKATPEEEAKTMAAWHEKYDKVTFVSNIYLKDGKSMAKCGCGKEFEVMSASPIVIENGIKMYCCSEACHEHALSQTAGERMTAELSLLKGESPAETPH